MQELYTRAWVLGREPSGEADELVTLYTEEYGKIRARARSMRKITSKVSSQLQPLTFSKVRFIRRNGPKDGFSILDALADDASQQPKDRAALIPIARLLSDMTYEWEADPGLWNALAELVKDPHDLRRMQRTIITQLGFDITHAACLFCGSSPVDAFIQSKHDFACASCAMSADMQGSLNAQASKLLSDEVYLI